MVQKSNSHVQSSVFDFIWLPNSVELNPRIEFDFVLSSLISENSIDYAGRVERLNFYETPSTVCFWNNVFCTKKKHQKVLVHTTVFAVFYLSTLIKMLENFDTPG